MSNTNTTIHVSNISSAIQKHHLEELFGACGQCDITDLVNDSINNTQSCDVIYSKIEDSKAALFLNAVPLGDKNIQVRYKYDNNDNNNAAVNDTQQQLQSSDNNQYTISSTSINSNSTGITDNGINNNNNNNNKYNLDTLHSTSVDHNNPASRTIYVGNLSPLVDETILHDYFNACGSITQIKFGQYDPSISMNRYAFIEFDTYNGCQQAKLLNGMKLAERPLKIGNALNSITNKKDNTSTTTRTHRTHNNNNKSDAIKVINEKLGLDNDLDDVEKQRASEAMRKVKQAQQRLAAKALGATTITDNVINNNNIDNANAADTSTNNQAANTTPTNTTTDNHLSNTNTTTTTTTQPTDNSTRRSPSPVRGLHSPSRSRSHTRSHSRSISRRSRSPDYYSRRRYEDIRDTRYNSRDRYYDRRDYRYDDNRYSDRRYDDSYRYSSHSRSPRYGRNDSSSYNRSYRDYSNKPNNNKPGMIWDGYVWREAK